MYLQTSSLINHKKKSVLFFKSVIHLTRKFVQEHKRKITNTLFCELRQIFQNLGNVFKLFWIMLDCLFDFGMNGNIDSISEISLLFVEKNILSGGDRRPWTGH